MVGTTVASASRICVEGCRASGWRDIASDFFVEHEESNTIATLERNVGEGQCGGEGVFEPWPVAYELRHHAAGIDHEHDGLALLDGKLARDEPLVTSTRFPVDVAWIVALDVFAKVGESCTVAVAAKGTLASVAKTLLGGQEPVAAHTGH